MKEQKRAVCVSSVTSPENEGIEKRGPVKEDSSSLTAAGP
uniref:Uncharacterized protein n=1 Tax=Anguilla anguilla TaxID=7936 RepID=A0A0E9QQT0_ANGAN